MLSAISLAVISINLMQLFDNLCYIIALPQSRRIVLQRLLHNNESWFRKMTLFGLTLGTGILHGRLRNRFKNIPRPVPKIFP